MDHFTAHHLHVEVEVTAPLVLNPHKGSSLRGGLFHALWNRFCMNKDALVCAECPLVATCPVALLVSTLRPDSERGRDVPRPNAIRPPLDPTTRYQPGDRFAFGLTLFAQALNLFPYVILALDEMGRAGLGLKLEENRWRRGTFRVQAVEAVNPLTGERRPVARAGESLVRMPNVPVTHAQVLSRARPPGGGRLTLHFLTPTRIIEHRELVKRPRFRPLFQRLLERLSALAREFSDTPLELDFQYLVRQAEGVELVADETRWVELASYSTRLRRATPIGGFVGRATYWAEDWEPFLPWLVWGQFTQVGKDAVKGNGWYEVSDGVGA
ncbi:MAG: hypothetical protein C4310_01940 [Chloroflexota bacterium]